MTKNEDLKACPEFDSWWDDNWHRMKHHPHFSQALRECFIAGMNTRPTPTDRRKNKRCEGRNACGGCYPAVCLETDGYERAREVVHKSPTDTAMEDASGFKAPILNSRMVPKNKAQQSASSTTDGDAERYFNLMIEAFFTNPHLLSVWEKEIKTIRTALQSTRKPPYSGDLNNAEYDIMKKRVEHYKNENIALRKQIEIFKAANKDELQ